MARNEGDARQARLAELTRRGMLGATAGLAVSGAWGFGPDALAKEKAAVAPVRPRKLKPSDTVNLAIIGAGGKGSDDAVKLTGQNIVAICDVDYDHVLASLKNRKGEIQPEKVAVKAAYDKAERFGDYRAMLDKRKDIDAVLIATPDHHHAVAARWAMERGLHVYVQKPLTWCIDEGRKLGALAAANPKLITQMGNQGHSGNDGRRVVELIRGGAIGKVSEVHVWTNRPVWPQGVNKPAAQPAPASLDWATWLGPANIDWGFNPDYGHFNWRGWTPFGSGALGDMGAHLIDFPVWALQPGLPTRVETRHTRWPGNPSLWDTAKQPAVLTGYPEATISHYEFGHAPGGPVTMIWYDGGLEPPTPKGWPAKFKMTGDGGVLFVGSKGMLMHETYGEKPVLIGEGLEEAAAAIPQSLPRIEGGMGGHEMNFIRAILGTEKISCPFEYAVPLNETMNLGVVAMRADQAIEWDGGACQVTNLPAANNALTREYRKGWEL